MSVFFVSVSSTNAFLEVYGVLFKSVFENLAVGGERVQWKVVEENSPHMGKGHSSRCTFQKRIFLTSVVKFWLLVVYWVVEGKFSTYGEGSSRPNLCTSFSSFTFTDLHIHIYTCFIYTLNVNETYHTTPILTIIYLQRM